MNRSARIASIGHAVFAVTLVGLGVQGLIKNDFAVIWQPVPKWVPARELLKYLCALIPIVFGAGLLWRRTARVAARVLTVSLLLWLLLVRVPHVVLTPTIDVVWAVCKIAIMAAAAWVLSQIGVRFARALYGLALIPLGIAHFVYLRPTAALVPQWLPWHLFWAAMTGVTFIAAGVAILTTVLARHAAVLSTIQMGLFGVLVWIPIVMKGANAFQWSEFVVTVALTAAGWVVADSYASAVSA